MKYGVWGESICSCIWNTIDVFCICISNTMKKIVFVFVFVFCNLKSICICIQILSNVIDPKSGLYAHP